MELSSILRRAQEAVQRDRATGVLFENVRIVAGKAAAAWAFEVLLINGHSHGVSALRFSR